MEARDVLGQPVSIAVGVLSEVSLEMGKWLQERMRDREVVAGLERLPRGATNRKEAIKAEGREAHS